MCKDEIYTQFIENLKEKISIADSIILTPDELDENDVITLKEVFHSLKGNLVALHFNKNFINQYGATIHSLLSKDETCQKKIIEKFYQEFRDKVEDELFN